MKAQIIKGNGTLGVTIDLNIFELHKLASLAQELKQTRDKANNHHSFKNARLDGIDKLLNFVIKIVGDTLNEIDVDNELFNLEHPLNTINQQKIEVDPQNLSKPQK